MYRLSKEQTVVKTDGTSFPCVDGNRDYEEYKNWLAEGNIPEPAFTDEELAEQEKQTAISEAKEYLTKTDWIVTKITEASIKGDNVTDMLSKYSAELAERTIRRELINSLEG